ncbi:RNA-guided endonuclease InsQ/TnpB family protein [Rhodococcus jostii]|uniref:RNA-guided endonuclease InsQ/TnpB family protein n=1 Tax=Rhodococcus jostii TaxID=132919 RepID=UPI00093395C7|nr:RNA-guided endonuclease TnpB family protein [Rhodococcus jostii]
MGEIVRYTYRLRPGATAETALVAEWHRCRFLWNEAVHQQSSGTMPTMGSLSRMLTEARARCEWLRTGSQVAQQQMLRNYWQALTDSFKLKDRGRPRQKARKRALPSLEFTTRGFSISDGRLMLPKGTTIPVVWSRELPSKPTSVRVYQDSIGHWYASFVVRRPDTPIPRVEGAIGIDWGVSTTATTTDQRYDLPYLRHRKRCAAELAKVQRKMARRRRVGAKPSRGYIAAKRQAARLQKKAARQTQHDSRIWARRVVEDHQLIAVEDFKPKFLVKSTMARKSADATIGAVKRGLIEFAHRFDRQLVLVSPRYTTMTCSSCFARAKQQLGLGEQTFRCYGCGSTAHRDRNAARVILAVAERGHTSVDDISHLQPSSGLVVSAVRVEDPQASSMGNR